MRAVLFHVTDVSDTLPFDPRAVGTMCGFRHSVTLMLNVTLQRVMVKSNYCADVFENKLV
jgi:hypothetical protein